MENIILPDPSIGKIEYETDGSLEIYYISKGELSFEKINGKSLLYIFASASHYEIHGEHTVYVEDLNFSLLMPVSEDELKNKRKLEFPNADSNHPDWEKHIHSSFYQFEHLLILNAFILLEETNGRYSINVTGQIGEGIGSNLGYKFNAYFQTNITDKIDRNKNYFLSE